MIVLNPFTGDLIPVQAGPKGDKGDPLSVPPSGAFKVVNIYVSDEGKLVVEYDDIPTP